MPVLLLAVSFENGAVAAGYLSEVDGQLFPWVGKGEFHIFIATYLKLTKKMHFKIKIISLPSS